MSDFYDENCNFLFVKKGNQGRLLDHIFIHLADSEGTNFLAYYSSYESNIPLKLFKLEEMALPDNLLSLNESIQTAESHEEQTWKSLRIKAVLPSTWRMLFESIVNNKTI